MLTVTVSWSNLLDFVVNFKFKKSSAYAVGFLIFDMLFVNLHIWLEWSKVVSLAVDDFI